MSAEILPIAGPRFSDNDFRAVNMWALRRIAERELNGLIDEAEAQRQMEGRIDFSLSLEQVNDAYEQLQEALARLAIYNDPMFDINTIEPEHRDHRMLCGNAEDDIEDALRKLVGRRRAPRTLTGGTA